ncbi:MAG TPA: single-stranded DNA-binding protein [Bacteroidetes bacterium]|nr:single-stranded DNA-binding protein [Bacteroidota bacterium]
MAKGTVNKVILIGRLGTDPDLRYTPSGQAVANFNIATDESWKSKDGQMQDRTEWHRIVLWGRQAEIANEYLKKGSRVYIEGRLQTRNWEDKDGVKRWTTEIIGQSMQFLDSRDAGSGSAAPPEPPPLQDSAPGAAPVAGGEDDLPF